MRDLLVRGEAVGRTFGPQPTVPTTSMSGSFQALGPACGKSSAWPKPILLRLDQVSVMSPVVRHRSPPTASPHSQTLPMPYWQRLKTMSRSTASRAARMTSYGFLSVGSDESPLTISP